jgi:hypothetical protein
MTYTFKLARRLAVSRHFIMLPVLLLFAACTGGDAMSPEGSAESSTDNTAWSPRDLTPVMVRINPNNVTLETNQLIHFRAHARTSAGDSVGAAVTWSTTGGTILPDGRFSAAAIGTYTVIGRSRVRGEVQADTTTVQVVRRQPKLASLEVSPTTASLTPGVSQTFAALGRLRNGNVVPVGVTWSSAGGSIDAGGTFVAGDTAGTFPIIAINTAGTIADTATVTITAPPSPPPPPPAPEPPAPVLEKVTLVPSGVTLAPRATKQFVAYGRMNTGDSVAVNVAFTATGGTVTSSGLYTAGSTTGTFRVIASVSGLADTSAVVVKAPLGSGNLPGIAFGNFDTKVAEFSDPYTGVTKILSPGDIFSYLDAARARKMRVILFLAGGPRNYQNADGTFSMDLWKQRVARFQGMDLSPYISDGTVLGNLLLDEPHDPTNWGGRKISFAQVEAMAQYSKQLFPTMTTFVRVHANWLEGYSWKYLDAAWAQYSARKGDVNTYLQSNVASAKALGLGLIIGMNTLDGGDGSSGIAGTYAGAYAMSAAEVKRYGKLLASDPYTCGFIMWKYYAPYLTRPDIASAMADVSAAATNRATAPCKVH